MCIPICDWGGNRSPHGSDATARSPGSLLVGACAIWPVPDNRRLCASHHHWSRAPPRQALCRLARHRQDAKATRPFFPPTMSHRNLHHHQHQTLASSPSPPLLFTRHRISLYHSIMFFLIPTTFVSTTHLSHALSPFPSTHPYLRNQLSCARIYSIPHAPRNAF